MAGCVFFADTALAFCLHWALCVAGQSGHFTTLANLALQIWAGGGGWLASLAQPLLASRRIHTIAWFTTALCNIALSTTALKTTLKTMAQAGCPGNWLSQNVWPSISGSLHVSGMVFLWF